jgi:hypothetical protein
MVNREINSGLALNQTEKKTKRIKPELTNKSPFSDDLTLHAPIILLNLTLNYFFSV